MPWSLADAFSLPEFQLQGFLPYLRQFHSFVVKYLSGSCKETQLSEYNQEYIYFIKDHSNDSSPSGVF